MLNLHLLLQAARWCALRIPSIEILNVLQLSVREQEEEQHEGMPLKHRKMGGSVSLV